MAQPPVNLPDGWTAELIQVAAVAVAIVEDALYGETGTGAAARILDLVAAERERQDSLWGAQHHSASTWLAILAEEVGEAARETPDLNPVRSALINAEHVARKAQERKSETPFGDRVVAAFLASKRATPMAGP